MLELAGVSRTWRGPAGRVAAVREASFHLFPGEFVAVRGASGCGKTTLLLTAGGLLAPDAGRVVVNGQDLYALSAGARAAFRARTIGFVFQQFHLIPYLTVFENVLAPSLAGEIPDARRRAEELIGRFGLSERRGHRPGELSVGECQRTALARALLSGPKLLLADEPTGNLDEVNARAVLDALADFAKGGGAALLVTHDARAAGHASRTFGMREGRME
ncbi:MAG: ABC transporter ATP-binding protein [Planctomycetota bacterium]